MHGLGMAVMEAYAALWLRGFVHAETIGLLV